MKLARWRLAILRRITSRQKYTRVWTWPPGSSGTYLWHDAYEHESGNVSALHRQRSRLRNTQLSESDVQPLEICADRRAPSIASGGLMSGSPEKKHLPTKFPSKRPIWRPKSPPSTHDFQKYRGLFRPPIRNFANCWPDFKKSVSIS